MQELTIEGLERCFRTASHQGKRYVAVLIRMEGFPRPEIIINENENIDTKFSYYKKAYTEDLVLKTFSGIRIIGFTFGDSFAELEKDLV